VAGRNSVLLLGDSLMAGVDDTSAVPALAATDDVQVDARIGRRTFPFPGDAAPAGLPTLQSYAGTVGDVLVLSLGANDNPASYGSGKPSTDPIAAMLAEARRQGISAVLWLNLWVAPGDPHGYLAIDNALTAATAAQSAGAQLLQVLDWRSLVDTVGQPSWFLGDGVHFTATGYAAMGNLIQQAVQALPVYPPTVGTDPCAGHLVGHTEFAQPAATVNVSPAGFVTTRPVRILDTRNGVGGFEGTVGAGRVIDLAIVDFGKVNVGAEAAVLDVVATGACSAGYVVAYPCGQPRPATSNLAAVPGRTVAAFTQVAVPTSGHVCLYSSATTDLVVDLFGWFSPGTGSGYAPSMQQRLADTRRAHPFGYPAGSSLSVPVNTLGASSALVNVTAVGTGQAGYVTAWPCGTTKPATSILNLTPTAVVANLAVVAIGTGGAICLSSSVAASLIVDLVGTYAATGASYVPAVPATRVLDTRTRVGGISGPVKAGSFSLVALSSAPAGAVAAGLTLTVTAAVTAGYLTVLPDSAPRTLPLATSTVNAIPGVVTANAAVTPIGSGGGIVVFSQPADQLIADVTGWYVTPPA
jgi:lysophospholipase L1-like esterase